MSERKTQLRFFTIPEWKKEENYLREMHKSGWEFVRVSPFCLYHFKKCEPQDVIYQLDYNPDSVAQKDEYIQLFRDCGWEYLQNFVGYSYFRKRASDGNERSEEIFCDDDSRLDMMKRIMKHRMLPLLCIFFLIIIPQIFVQSLGNTPVNRVLLVIFCIMFFIYLILFTAFAIQFRSYARSIGR